jgi:nucleoside 2-deoxyribosyltransferase
MYVPLKRTDEMMEAKKQIYLAGPLFSKAERDFNVYLRDKLVEIGFRVFLPQVDGEDNLENRMHERQMCIFENDIKGIDQSDIVLAVLDGGSDVDSGTAWEMGYAYARGKKILGLKTDFRTFGEEGIVNLMMEMSVDVLARDVEEIIKVLEAYR